MTDQIHDDYWNFTLAYTDYNSDKFIGLLRAVVNYIDRADGNISLTDRYNELQKELQQILDLNEASIRKAINQLVKMGFVDTGLGSYHQDAKSYINARDNSQRKILLSRQASQRLRIRGGLTCTPGGEDSPRRDEGADHH